VRHPAFLGHSRKRRESFQRHDPFHSSRVARKEATQGRRLFGGCGRRSPLQRGICLISMGLSFYLLLYLLAAVGVMRLVELYVSRRNFQRMLSADAIPVPEPHFKWIVVIHTGMLIGTALEVIFLKRPLIPWLATIMFALFITSNLLRL